MVDPLTIRFHTASPHPLLPTELASIYIISRHAGHGGGDRGLQRRPAAIGTGPYRFVSHRSGDRTEFTRNDAYWAGAQPWPRVSYRFIANDPRARAALLAGDVDVIDQVPSSDLARLRREPRVACSRSRACALIYLMPGLLARGDPLPGHRQ